MMKTILLLSVLIPLQVFAGLPPTALKGQSGSNVTTFNFQVPHSQATQVSGPTSLIETGNQNILQNPGFEGTGDWTASGGATTAINTTAVGTGSKGYDWDSNSASQTLSSDSVTIPNGLKGKNGVVSCAIKTVSGTATHTLQAYDGTNILASTSITSDTGSFARTSLNFVFPTSGSAVLRLVSVASNEPEIYIDDCYMGLAEGFNIGAISQFGDWTSYGSASSWAGLGTPTSNYLEYRTAPQGMEIRFKVTSGTSTAVPATLTLPSSCTTASNYASNEMAGPAVITTTTGRTWTPLVSASATTVSFGDVATANAFTARNGSSLISSGEVAAGQFFVRCQGFSSNTVYRPEVNSAYWSGYHDSTCYWNTASASYANFPADASCSLTQTTSRGISCSATGSTLPSIACSLPKSGTYYVCAKHIGYTSTSNNTAVRLWDGTTVISEVEANISDYQNRSNCGLYEATSLTPTFSLQGKVGGSGSFTIASAAASRLIEWTIFPITGNMPAPVLVGSVTSNSTGAIRVEGASIAAPSGGACAVTEIGGSDWINGNATSGGTGLCVLTFNSSIWSAAPVCTCTTVQSTGNSRYCNVTTSSTSTVTTFTTSSPGTATNDVVNLICVGPR